MSERSFQILAGCQNPSCAEEVSYHMNMLAWWNDEPICEECFKDLPSVDKLKPGEPEDGEDFDWNDLPALHRHEARP